MVTEAEAEVVHRLAQHGRCRLLGIEVGIAAGENRQVNAVFHTSLPFLNAANRDPSSWSGPLMWTSY